MMHHILQQAVRDLQNEYQEVRIQAIRNIRRVGSAESVPILLEVTDDADPVIRAQAILALGGLRVKQAIPRIVNHLLADTDVMVRETSAAVLAWFSDENTEAVYIQSLDDSSDNVVFAASVWLGRSGHSGAIEPLQRLMLHTSRKRRLYGCIALIELGFISQELVDTLTDICDDKESSEYNIFIEKIRVTNRKTGNTIEPLSNGLNYRSLTTDELLNVAYQSLKKITSE